MPPRRYESASFCASGMGIAYNFAVMLFGGFAPFIVTWLIQETGSPIAPAFYIMFCAVSGFGSALLMREEYLAAAPVPTSDLRPT
jgi:MFS transporter, MHS family, proline/betaine transporter